MYLPTESNRNRNGFTLVEILLIVAIIAILTALASVAYFKFTNTTQAGNTQARMQGIYKPLQENWKKVIEDARKEDPSDGALWLAGGNRKRAQIIHIKARLMEAFPMTYAEIKFGYVYQEGWLAPGAPPLLPVRQFSGLPNYSAAYNLVQPKYQQTYRRVLGLAGNRTTAIDPDTESSACLRLALTTIKRAAATTDLNKYENDTDDDGMPEFVDDWNNAMWFFRFPTGDPKLDQAAPVSNLQNASFRDPIDPAGELINAQPPTPPKWNPALQQIFAAKIHPVSANGYAPSHYVIPVLVSAGLLEKMGLNRTNMAVTNLADSKDNIYCYTFEIGGQLK